MKKDKEMQESKWILNELNNIKLQILNLRLKIKDMDRILEKLDKQKNRNEFDEIMFHNLESRICILEEETEKYDRN